MQAHEFTQKVIRDNRDMYILICSLSLKSDVSEITLAERHKTNVYNVSMGKYIVMYLYNGILHSDK